MHRIFTYNLLAPLFVRSAPPGVAPYAEFQHTADEHITWEYRAELLQRRLSELPADILCLQEVQYTREQRGAPWRVPWRKDRFEWVMPELSEGEWKHLEERNKRVCGEAAAIGLAVGFDATRYELVRTLSNQRGMVVFLRPLEGAGERPLLAVCNVHLEGHPDLVDERRKQLFGTLKRARREATAHVILLGDFNSSWDDELSKYDAVEDLVHVQTGHTWHGFYGNPRALDHILVDPSVSVLSVQESFTNEDLELGMPNENQPSDHAPLGVFVEIVGVPPAVAAKNALEVSEERQAQIGALCAELGEHKPPAVKGKPTPEQLKVLKEFAQRKKDFLARFTLEGEQRVAKKLLKKL